MFTTWDTAAISAVSALAAAASAIAAIVIAIQHSPVRSNIKLDKLDPIKKAFIQIKRMSTGDQSSEKSSSSINVTSRDGGAFSVSEIVAIDYGAVTLAHKNSLIAIRYSEIASVQVDWGDHPDGRKG